MKIIVILLIAKITLASSIDLSNITGIDLRAKSADTEVSYLPTRTNVFLFLSANCPCSKSYFDYLNNLAKKFRNINFIGFHSSKTISKETAKQYFSNFDIVFPILLDKKLLYADRFKALKTPHIFVTNNTGEILYHGAVADSRHINSAKKFYLEEALENISNGTRPQLQFAKALGCYIAR